MEVIEMKVLIIFIQIYLKKRRIKTMQYYIYNIHKIKILDNNIHVCMFAGKEWQYTILKLFYLILFRK